MMPRFLLVLASAVAVLVVAAAPAAADPAGPTHYDSFVTSVDGPEEATAHVSFEVLGGDAFLVVHAEPGVVVEVPGYSGEPYVRIDADGAVQVNERSESRYVNDDRYGDIAVPAIADNDAPPSWVQEAEGGTYAWHEHRIHYMSPSLPRGVDPGAGVAQPVWDWTVPVTVDGEQVDVQGELVWLPGPSPAAPIGLAGMLGLLAIGIVWRWRASLVPLIAAMVVVTGGIGIAKMSEIPPGADGEPALLVLPAISVAALALGSALARQRPSAAAIVPAAGIPLLVWGILQGGALTRPIVPGPLSIEVVRVAVAAALAVGAAALVAGGRDLASVTALRDDGPSERPVPTDA